HLGCCDSLPDDDWKARRLADDARGPGGSRFGLGHVLDVIAAGPECDAQVINRTQARQLGRDTRRILNSETVGDFFIGAQAYSQHEVIAALATDRIDDLAEETQTLFG